MTKSAFDVQHESDSSGFLLWQTTIIWQRLIKKALEPHAITHPQFVLMAILLWFEENNISATQAALVAWSKLDKMTVSQSLRKLSDQRYINRTEHPTDSRSKSVCLSVRGRVTASTLVLLVEEIDAKFFGKLTDSERKMLNTLLQKLVKGQDEKAH